MTTHQWERIKELTADALDLSPARRSAFVTESCGDDPAVLDEVLRLVRQAESAGEDFLKPVPRSALAIVAQGRDTVHTFQPNQIVAGRFRIERFLDRGGMGEVYAAWDLELQETVALKTIRAAIAAARPVIERFKLEVRHTRNIAHPNVCKVYDLFQHQSERQEPVWFLTMEYLDGESLAERLRTRGPLSLEQARPLIEDMVSALAAAHAAGTIHRDFKPANVMLTTAASGREQAKVMDFGLALTVGQEGVAHAAADGTRVYMAPEQAAGEEVSRAADQFAFGLVVCEMLTGTKPDTAEWTAGTARKQLDAWLRSQPSAWQNPRVREAIRRCLAFRPADRFPEIQAVVPALRDRPRRRGVIAGVGVAAAMALAMVGTGRWTETTVADSVQLTPDSDLSAPFHLSHSGKWLAYATDRAEPGNTDIWLRPLPDGEPRRLTVDAAEDTDANVSPDGRQVAFRSERGGGGIYLMTTAGRDERLLAPGGRNPTFSPDGRWIAYWTGNFDDSAPSARVYLIAPEGGPARRFAESFADARFPVWNTQENVLLFQGCRDLSAPLAACLEFWAGRLGGGEPQNTGVAALLRARRIESQTPPLLAWRDERVYFGGVSRNVLKLWELGLSRRDLRVSGEPRAVTSGVGAERDPSVAEDGTIAFGRSSGALHIWQVSLNQPEAERDIRLTNDLASDCCPSLSGNGRSLFFTRKTGDYRQLVVRDLQSGLDSTLPGPEGNLFWPIPDHEGQNVALEARREDESAIVLVSRGKETRTLCRGCSHPTGWYADGETLFYTTAKGEIALLDVRTGRTEAVLAGSPGMILGAGEWSSAHRHLVFTASRENDAKQIYVARFDRPGLIAGSQWISLTSEAEATDQPHWSKDGRSVIYLSNRDGHMCLWRLPFDPVVHGGSGKPVAVRHYHDSRITPDRTGPRVRGLSVGAGSIYLNVGEMTEAIWIGALRSPLSSLFRFGGSPNQ